MSDFNEAGVCSIVRNIISTADLTANTDPTANTDTSTDTVYLAAAVNLLTTDRKSFLCLQNLPDLNTIDVPNGHLAYLCDAKTMIVASNCSWIGLDGRTIGQVTENRLFSWGEGRCGVLGIGINPNSCSPVREICRATNWCTAAIGHSSSSAIKADGSLWGWGWNRCGVLGDGNTFNSCSPIREICSSTDWCFVGAGYATVGAIKTDGSLWNWGWNNCGVLGDGTIILKCSPIREICSATDWSQIKQSCISSFGLKKDGSIWVWGIGLCGQLGDGTVVLKCSPVREFCSATNWCLVEPINDRAALALKTTGEIWGWGWNACGVLGDGTTFNKCSPIREICSSTDWCTLSGGASSAAAIKTSGSLWAWGRNLCGQLGDGTYNQTCSPIQEFCSATDWNLVKTGLAHTIAIKTDGTLWSWGRNCIADLGDGTTISKSSPVREICSAIDWCFIAVSNFIGTSLAISATKVVCR